MRVKMLYIIVLCQITAFQGWGQNIDEIFDRGSSKSEKGSTTLRVDNEIVRAKTPEEEEKEKQDLIRKNNDKWRTYLSGKNNAMQQLSATIRQLDSEIITKEEIEEYRIQVNSLKRQVDNKIQNDGSWKESDTLDDMYASFLDTYDLSILKLDHLTLKIDGKKPDKLIILGGCLAAIMVGIPIIMQVKSRLMNIKIDRIQKLQTKKQAEEMERQMLLTNEDNIITLK